MIIIVDYGMGNLGSIINMFRKMGVEAKASSSIKEIEKASKVILPGVGAFDSAMLKIKEHNYLPVLNYKANEEKVPFLGICLGFQLLTRGSEEGKIPGLGWIDAYTYKFNFEENHTFKVPHMGWNEVNQKKPHPILNDLSQPSRFYFVHSYYVKCSDHHDILLSCDYSFEFTCAIQKENIFGMQFHPEKSHKYGMQVLKNFNSL